MERQSLTSIDAALRNVTGIAVSLRHTAPALLRAGLSGITDFKVDGLPTYSGGTNQEYDTALYERIDVVRGANGILTAIGVPSATVDMIRKRPQREFAASVALTAGSWNLWRGELDLNTPLTSDGSVRSRPVVAPQTKESFRDRYQEDKTALLAAIEADLGNATVATVGFQRQRNVPEAPIWGTIPRFVADGGLANLPVSTSFSPSWMRWERTSSTLYANVDHQINEDWSAKVSLNHTEGDSFRLATYGSGYLNRSTGAGLDTARRRQRRHRVPGHPGRLPVGQGAAGRSQARPGGGHERIARRGPHRQLQQPDGLDLQHSQPLHLGRQRARAHSTAPPAPSQNKEITR